MTKLRCLLAAMALLATLIGLSLQETASMANAASSRQTSAASAQFVAGKLTKARPYGQCPGGGTYDC